MNQDTPWKLRSREAPSEVLLDALAAGEATVEERARIEAWVGDDLARRALVEARLAGFAALPMADPVALRARLEQRLAAVERAPRPSPVRLGWRRWGLAMAVPAAAALIVAVLIVLPDQPPNAIADDGLRVKGAASLRIFRQRGPATTELMGGATVQAGDRLRFRPEGLPSGSHLMVVGREATGHLFPYAPQDGRSLALAGLDTDGALPGSAELDASTGREACHLVWCSHAFDLSELATGKDGLLVPDGCHNTLFPLVKL